MDTKIVAGVITTAFMAGFISGSNSMRRLIIKRLKKHNLLISSVLIDIMEKAKDENLSQDDVMAYAKEQLVFMKIVIGK